jgi:hypothetical protein
MLSVKRLLREGRSRDVWQLGCGFLDLTLDGLRALQRRMLMEQMELLQRCELGQRGADVQSMEDFRRYVPLTGYEDYAPYLLEQQEDALRERPVLWQRTLGRSGEYPLKLIPVTGRVYEEMGSAGLAMLLLSSHAFKGDVALAQGDRFLYGMAAPPLHLRHVGPAGQ